VSDDPEAMASGTVNVFVKYDQAELVDVEKPATSVA